MTARSHTRDYQNWKKRSAKRYRSEGLHTTPWRYAWLAEYGMGKKKSTGGPSRKVRDERVGQRWSGHDAEDGVGSDVQGGGES